MEKNEINVKLYNHYEQKFFRKFKLNIFINTQKSESKMIKNFSKKFGKPQDTLYIMGDYDKGNYNMKGIEPVICKKFRRIFKNAGYKTYLINEFRTSKLCNQCSNELEMFLQKPFKDGTKLCHGLLRCQSIKRNPLGSSNKSLRDLFKPKCETIHNRDKNAVQNMLNIVSSIFDTGQRPTIFSRLTI